MTAKLKTAFKRASSLPDDDQDSIASMILEEIESEGRWQEAFARSEKQLTTLAREAREEFRAGNTAVLDPDKM